MANADKIKDRVRSYTKNNREAVLHRRRERWAAHAKKHSINRKNRHEPTAEKERFARWYSKNRLRRLKKCLLYGRANRDAANQRNSAWRKKNRPKMNAENARYRAALLRATPSWADHSKILAIYEEAQRMTIETGIPHHVDHHYPLQSDWCCGLHVETNLRILTAKANARKGNRRPEIFS